MTIAESIVDSHTPSHRRPYSLPIEQRFWSVWRIEAGVNAAITTIILSIMKNISKLIVNSGFLIDKLINKYKITHNKLVLYVSELGPNCQLIEPSQADAIKAYIMVGVVR